MKNRRHRQSGAALLAAMLTVMLVATFSAAALWQQWRAVEVEAAERARVQAAWVLVGALDWSRLILGEDARSASKYDALTEPWAVPLEEARLSSFLAADKNIASDSLEGLPDAFLSGRIVDAQAKLNVRNLVNGNQPDKAAADSFEKLFTLLGLPTQDVALMVSGLQQALASGSNDSGDSSSNAPLMPEHSAQLVWFGLSEATVTAIEPYVTVLPERTSVNLNTASAEVIFASAPLIDLASAKRMVQQRAVSPFGSVADASRLAGTRADAAVFDVNNQGVATNYFEVLGRLRLGNVWVEEHSLLKRPNSTPGFRPVLRVIWRERGAGTTGAPPAL